MDTDSLKIPTMLLQPYIENALKHGLLHKKGNKTLMVYFEKFEKHLEIKIEDNGIGREKSAALNLKRNKFHRSFATDALDKRVALLNDLTQKDYAVYIKDKKNTSGNAAGTVVTLKLPLNY